MNYCALLLALAPAFADSPKLDDRARALVTALGKEDFAAAAKDFDDAMTKAVPPDKLGDIWKGLVKQVGPLKKQGKTTAEKVQKYDVIWVACEFEKATLYTRVVFDAEGRVTGLSFRDSGPTGEYKAPAYVKRDAFKESAVQVGEGEWALPGTLALPAGDGPFPAVVLVHGSGPQDRDETIGPSRPFRDLAWGLASQGIAVLRYEKRTREHGAKLKAKAKDITVKEEVLDDALAAVALLRKTKGIDPKRVFVLGHSLGAMAAPRLGERDLQIAGLILMAGPSRDMGEVIIEQVDYILLLDPSPSEEHKSEVAKLKKQAEKLKDPKLSADTPAEEMPFGQSAAYWLSVRELAQVETARKVKQPLLILQGGRDYQVTMADFDGWKKALAGRAGATLKSYPRLNHVFAEGEGKAKPAEYQKEGHVAKEVIDDIASWVKRGGKEGR
jgi:dienelactone hydrolase